MISRGVNLPWLSCHCFDPRLGGASMHIAMGVGVGVGVGVGWGISLFPGFGREGKVKGGGGED